MFGMVVVAATLLAGRGECLPIVYGERPKDERAAKYLQSCVKDMTGVEPKLIRGAQAADVEKAVFIVSDNPRTSEAFRVVAKDGAIRFTGAAYHATYDFCERVLDVRQYWPTQDDGRSVIRRETIEVEDMDYSDRPFFTRRENYPFDATEWGAAWRPGGSHVAGFVVHAPHKWVSDTNYNYLATRPEIFQRTRDGKRGCGPMLCYGNPRTLETYKERIVDEIEHGVSAGGIVSMKTKCITVSQWDARVACTCEHCAKLRDPSLGITGDASPILWGYFVKELSEWLHGRYPDWKIVILPYLNTTDLPKGLAFPHRNVEAFVCTVPGMAMLKQKDVKEREESVLRAWAKATGLPVQVWHYSCWPHEFTAAPYVYGETIAAHYRDCRDLAVGAFINGPYTRYLERQSLSVYVWMKALWNPDIDVHAIYDEFASRMFGKGAKPMRELVRMQEAGWNRQWKMPKINNRNIYEISYPRADVLRMQELFAEAKRLAADDELSLRRIAFYEKGFAQFFKESEEYASGSAFATTMMMKAGSMPIIDGALDEDDWSRAEKYDFVPALDRQKEKADDPTDLRVLWVPGQGVVYGIRGWCGDMAHIETRRPLESYSSENVDIYFEPSGTGECKVGHLHVNINNQVLYFGGDEKDPPEGVRTAVKRFDDRWEMEVFVPFSLVRALGDAAQVPAGMGGGQNWAGNVVRMHFATNKKGYEMTRLHTRYNAWNHDTAAFGAFHFAE